MRNLIGYLKTTLWKYSFLIAFFLFSFFLPQQSYSLEGFDIQTDFYHIWDGENISSTIYLNIATTENPRVITYYTITIPQENIKPEVFSINKNAKLEPTYYNRKGATDMVIDLENTVVSKDKPITLKLTYNTKHTKENLSVIASVNDTTSRSFSFTYPNSYGDISWSSSPITKITQEGVNTQVQIAPSQSNNINITLGENISYDFAISRNLINSSESMISSEINIPPNTNTQRIIISQITPTPNKAYMDINGNYILQYEIAPQSNIDVSILGSIIMDKSIYSDLDIPNIENRSLWEIKDTDLENRIDKYLIEQALIKSKEDINSVHDLKDINLQTVLYKTLYQFVIDNLEPNALTIGSLAGSVRLGGERALSQQAQSTSEDYADSIISLYRHFDIPARLVIGYVTNISDYHPDGMYHYWVEYFDIQQKDWIQVDPFLEDYSKTSLWGRKLLDHVTLIYRYDNPNTPKLSYFTENDFKIEMSDTTPATVYDFEAKMYLKPYRIIDSHLQGSVEITNIGNTIIDGFHFVKSNPDMTKYTDFIENNSSNILLPNEKSEIKFNIPSLKIDTPIYMVLKASSGTQLTEEKYLETNLELLENNTSLYIFSKLVSILFYISLFIPLYFISQKISKRYGKQ